MSSIDTEYVSFKNPFQATIGYMVQQNRDGLLHGIYTQLSSGIQTNHGSEEDWVRRTYPNLNWSDYSAFVKSLEASMTKEEEDALVSQMISNLLIASVRICFRDNPSLVMTFLNPIYEDLGRIDGVRRVRRTITSASRLFILSHLGYTNQIRSCHKNEQTNRWIEILSAVMEYDQCGILLSPTEIRTIINPCIQRTITEMSEFLYLDEEEESKVVEQLQELFAKYTYHEEKEDLMSHYFRE